MTPRSRNSPGVWPRSRESTARRRRYHNRLAMAEVHRSEWLGWRWLPDASAWFACVRHRACVWSPPDALGLDVAALRAVLTTAAEQHAPWLMHPCTSVLLNGDTAPV